VDAGTSEATLVAMALAQPRVVAVLNGREPSKVIAVVDRIVNIVMG
jgi:leucyl-tRNA synthetase